MAPEERSDRFALRMSPRETAMLAALADESGLSGADVLRSLLRDAYKSKFGDKLPKPKK